MPVPKPRTGEDLQTYVSRCIPALKKLDPEKPDAQIKAICYSTWRRAHGQTGTKKMATETWELDKEGRSVVADE